MDTVPVRRLTLVFSHGFVLQASMPHPLMVYFPIDLVTHCLDRGSIFNSLTNCVAAGSLHDDCRSRKGVGMMHLSLPKHLTSPKPRSSATIRTMLGGPSESSLCLLEAMSKLEAVSTEMSDRIMQRKNFPELSACISRWMSKSNDHDFSGMGAVSFNAGGMSC